MDTIFSIPLGYSVWLVAGTSRFGSGALRQFLGTDPTESAPDAPAGFGMGAIHLGPPFVTAHLGQQVEQGVFESRGIVHGEVAGGVVDDAVGRTLAVGFFRQQAIGGHLINVRVVGRFGDSPSFYLDRDDLSLLLDEVIGFAGETEFLVEERLFERRAPGAGISVDDASAGQTGLSLLAVGLPEEEEGEEDESEGEEKHSEQISVTRHQ